MKTIFNNEDINRIANILLDAGFDIVQYKPENNWFTYHKDGNLAYFQYDRLEGYTISSIHKPNKNCGTGFRLLTLGKDTENYEPTIKDFEAGFVFAPDWALRQDREAVKKWESLEKFIERETILKYTVIYA